MASMKMSEEYAHVVYELSDGQVTAVRSLITEAMKLRKSMDVS